MEIPKYITEMSDKEFLKSLDDYGNYWVYIHEAAKRIRRLKQDLAQQQDAANVKGWCLECDAEIYTDDANLPAMWP